MRYNTRRTPSPFALFKAVRTTVRADSDPSRVLLFDSLARANRTVRVAVGIHAIFGRSWISTMFVGSYGLRTLLTMKTVGAARPNVLTVAIHANASHQVQRVVHWLPTMTTAAVRFKAVTLFSWSSMSQLIRLVALPRDFVTALRILHRINGRYGFLVSCRVASTLACYSRALVVLQQTGAQAVVVSSDTNPEEVGVAAAARRLDVATVFIAHAHPNAYTPSLDFTLALMEGEAALELRKSRGPVNGTVRLIGIEGPSRELNPLTLRKAAPVVGIFAPKVVSWPSFVEAVMACRRCGASRILIRWHPSMIGGKMLAAMLPDLTDIFEMPRLGRLTDVARQCDWAVSDENSNVHLQLLKLGVPTVAFTSLGVHPNGHEDAYGFIANGVIPAPVSTIDRAVLRRVEEFYGLGWAQRFTRYDTAYLVDPERIERLARAACERAIRYRTIPQGRTS